MLCMHTTFPYLHSVLILLSYFYKVNKNVENEDNLWNKVVTFVERLTDKKAKDVNAILFLIGVQEIGSGNKSYTKEQKQDLIHVGTCTVLCIDNYYVKESTDEEGWPHFKLLKKVPHGKIGEQELFLRHEIVKYFQEKELI